MDIKFSKGNAKLSKNVLIWNLPAGAKYTCAFDCVGCYAIKAQKRFERAINSRKRNLRGSKENNFVNRVVEFLTKLKKPPKYVRVHESGDFYSQEYVDKWVEIAKRVPYITFYTYTKRLGDFDFSELSSLKNFVVHNSLLSSYSPDLLLNYGNEKYLNTAMSAIERTGKEAFVCPLSTDREQRCGDVCTWCMEKANQNSQILFKLH